VSIDSGTGLVTATRLSDKTVLLHQQALVWGTPGPKQARLPGAVTAQVSFTGLAADEDIYGKY
jgi:hypothetical protein